MVCPGKPKILVVWPLIQKKFATPCSDVLHIYHPHLKSLAQNNVNSMLTFLGKGDDKECWCFLVYKETAWIKKKQHRGYLVNGGIGQMAEGRFFSVSIFILLKFKKKLCDSSLILQLNNKWHFKIFWISQPYTIFGFK